MLQRTLLKVRITGMTNLLTGIQPQHGQRHQIQHEYEESQLKDYKTKPADIISSEVYHEILKCLHKWEEADCALVGLQNPFDIRMGEH